MRSDFLDLIDVWINLDTYHPAFNRLYGKVKTYLLQYRSQGLIVPEVAKSLLDRAEMKLVSSSRLNALSAACSDMFRQKRIEEVRLNRLPLEYYLLLRDVCFKFSTEVQLKDYSSIGGVMSQSRQQYLEVLTRGFTNIRDSNNVWFNYSVVKEFTLRCLILSLVDSKDIAPFKALFEYMENVILETYNQLQLDDDHSMKAFGMQATDFDTFTIERDVFLMFLDEPNTAYSWLNSQYASAKQTKGQEYFDIIRAIREGYQRFGIRDVWNPIYSYQIYLETGIRDHIGYRKEHVSEAKDFGHYVLTTIIDETLVITALEEFYQHQVVDTERVDVTAVNELTLHNLKKLWEYSVIMDKTYYKYVNEVNEWYEGCVADGRT